MLNKTILIPIIFLLLALFNVSAWSQASDNGSLSGTITDPNGSVVPNATVTATNIGRGAKRTATANQEGRYIINVLPLGDYEVKAEAANFQPAKQTITVTSGTTTSLDLVLGITVDPNRVTVTDDSGLVNQNNSGTIIATFKPRDFEEKPLVARATLNALLNDTSIGAEIPDPNTNGTGNPESTTHGARTTSTGFQFNGIDATNFSGTGSLTGNISPAPETVQEINFLSSGYDASLGRSGGGSVQLTTRSGENAFKGVAYIYAQNEAFNANDFFFNREAIDRQKARRVEGGFTLGGRIIKDKLFFFGGYQKTDASTAYVPTAQSFVILPEALAFITDRSNPLSVYNAFRIGQRERGGAGAVFQVPSCISNGISRNVFAGIVLGTCLDTSSAGYRLLNLRNPVTGDFFIPTLIPGRYERLFVDPNNVDLRRNNVRVTQAELAALGFPNGPPLLDLARQEIVGGGQPLVRVRNVFPADFKQDQFTTKLDYLLSNGDTNGNNSNTLSGTFFFANFPATDPFSTDTLVSPTPLIRNDRNRTLAVTDTHVFDATLINEARFGYFSLNNSRKLDERFLASELTNSGLGIFNPASVFEPGPPTQRAARFAGTGNLSDFSLGAPTDIYNQRKQLTLTFADNLTNTRGNHTLRFGVEHKRNFFDTNLPEEQSGEFEGLENFGQLLISFVPEADVSFGITDKQFRFNDLSFYVSDDWRFSERLTLNLGLRWDWFGLPTEKNGRFSNFDFSRVTDPNDITPGFILPSNATATGFNAIDASLPTIADAGNDHTLNGQDLNNFAPRVGFAFKPFKNDGTIIRGGYGIFYDRPSAAFINTIYSNYPFFKEIELSQANSPFVVQAQTAFIDQIPNLPFSSYFPFRLGVNNLDTASRYFLTDNTPGAATTVGSEPLEFRAIDRDLKTPLIQQWNIGIQKELFKNWVVEARYVGTRGQQLLLAVGFNQPYDLNDPNTPDYIFARLNAACLSAPGCDLPSSVPGQSERDRGASTAARNGAFGSCNPSFRGVPGYAPCLGGIGGFDYNLNPVDFNTARGIISADTRVPFLGFDGTDAVILQSRGYSIYHSGQLNVTRRFSKGFSVNASYTFSKSIDIGSTDPGSTTASGRPDTPNLGLVVQGDQRNLNANRGLSDFDRPHRFAGSFVWELPNFGSKSRLLTGWQLSGFGQWQSGTPFSIFASDASFAPDSSSSAFTDQFRGLVRRSANRNGVLGANGFSEVSFNVGVGSGTIYNTAFGRPNVSSLALLRQRNCSDITRCYFNTNQDPNNPDTALFAPLGGFGNLGRNVLRGPSQRRIDFSLQKSTKLSDRMSLELKWDIFNVFNFVNFANPNSDLSDETDFGQITRTVGSPRVMQFGAKLRF